MVLKLKMTVDYKLIFVLRMLSDFNTKDFPTGIMKTMEIYKGISIWSQNLYQDLLNVNQKCYSMTLNFFKDEGKKLVFFLVIVFFLF
jgi:hypothetical protein